MEERTWWAQTLVALGGGWSPDVYGLHSVQATTEEEAVGAFARETGAPEDPPPAVLPHIERDARARGEDDDAIVEALKKGSDNRTDERPERVDHRELPSGRTSRA